MINLAQGALLVLVPFTVLSLQILLRPRGRFLRTLPVTLLAVPYIVLLFLTGTKQGFDGFLLPALFLTVFGCFFGIFMGCYFRWTLEEEKKEEENADSEDEQE